MGFRNPLKTATGVDTGNGSGPRIVVDNVVLNSRSASKAPALLGYTDNAAQAPGAWYVLADSPFGGPSTVIESPNTGGPIGRIYIGEDPINVEGWMKLAVGRIDVTGARMNALEVITTAAGSAWSPGWSSWDDGINQNLTFVRTVDNLCHVSGYVRYTTGVAGATTKIFSLGGNFRPLGLRHPLIGNQGDTFRGCEVRSDGLYLRGALPAASGFLAFNGVYPGILAST